MFALRRKPVRRDEARPTYSSPEVEVLIVPFDVCRCRPVVSLRRELDRASMKGVVAPAIVEILL